MVYCGKCKKRAFYNKEGESKGLYCKTHMTNGMVNVVSPRCIHDGCKKRSSFNTVGKKTGLYCKTHKKKGMFNVTEKRICIHDGCDSRCPTFNMSGEKKGLYCGTHKQNGMVDVVNPKCIHEGCISINPCFNKVGEKKGLYCKTHMTNGMVNVKNKICKTHLCYTQVKNNKYEGYCLRCYIHIFPDRPVARNYKTKEHNTVEHIKKAFPNFTWIEDKRVEGGCFLYRPDLKVDLGTHILITEIDENKHESYNCSCENKRIQDIYEDLGHRPIVFIRFNPDSYIDTNGNKITSCWGVNKLGIMTIKKTKEKEWVERINTLNNQIQYWVDNKPDEMIETLQLFY